MPIATWICEQCRALFDAFEDAAACEALHPKVGDFLIQEIVFGDVNESERPELASQIPQIIRVRNPAGDVFAYRLEGYLLNPVAMSTHEMN